jgi:hypothetical protein
VADDEHEAGASGTAKDPDRNGTIWAVLGILMLIFIAGAAVVSATKPKKPPPPVNTTNKGTRAVIVPTDDAARTVVVVPCGTGAAPTKVNPENIDLQGSSAVKLPKGEGTRVLLVPRCAAGKGAQTGTNRVPSALFVTEPGTPQPKVGGGAASSSSSAGSSSSASSSSQKLTAADPAIADAQLILTSPNRIKTIVVPPCETPESAGPGLRILDAKPGSDTAIAPGC